MFEKKSRDLGESIESSSIDARCYRDRCFVGSPLIDSAKSYNIVTELRRVTTIIFDNRVPIKRAAKQPAATLVHVYTRDNTRG